MVAEEMADGAGEGVAGGTAADGSAPAGEAPNATPAARRPKKERRAVLLRLDPKVHDALSRWAQDDLRSVNAQIEVILRDGLRRAGRLPSDAGELPKRGRPRKDGQ